MHACVLSCVWLLVAPWTVARQAPLPSGKSTGVGCHFFLQGIFPTQGLNSHLLHREVDSLLPSHQGNQVSRKELKARQKDLSRERE